MHEHRPAVGRGRRQLTTRAALLIPLVVLLWIVSGQSPAKADISAVETCERSTEHACVQVNVFGTDRSPVKGVTVILSGPDGSTAEAISGDGPTTFQVSIATRYEVTLEPDTIPEGYPAAAQGRQVTAQLGSTARATFNLAQASPGAPSTETSQSPGTATATPSDTPESSAGTSSSRVWNQLASGLRFGLMLALASVGANLIYGTTKVSNFAHGEQVTLGAVLAYLLVQAGAPVLLAACVTIVVCAASGWLQDAAIWHPLRRRGTPVTQVMIVTIGLSIALQFLIQFLVGTGTFQVISGNPRTWTIGPVTMPVVSYLAMAISVVVLGAVAWFLTRTRLGRATRAVSDNPALASATGINTNRVVRLVWTLACGLAGLAGLLFALMFGAANWNMGLQMLLLMFAAITLGGLGTAYGALVGSLIIGMAVELSSLFIPSDLRYATALLILIIVLLARPQGILGLRDRIG